MTVSNPKRLATMPAITGQVFGCWRLASRVRWRSRPGFLTSFAACFVLTFGLVWAYVALMPMAFLDRDYPLWVAKRSMLDACRPGVAVFGDSRALAATVPGVMPIPVTNYALSGTSPIETYFAVTRALRCRRPPSLVVIAHGALKFSGDTDYWNFGAHTGFLDLHDMRLVDADARRLRDTELQDLRRGDQLSPLVREVLFALRFPSFYFSSLINAGVAARWLHNRHALADCLASSGHALFGRANGSNGIAAEGDGSGFMPSPLVDLYFSRTLALLAKRGIPTVLVTIPINQSSDARMNPDLRDDFDTYMRLKATQFPSVQLATSTIPCWPDRYFGDAWHFNARGADAYSRALGVWLRERLAGRTPRSLPSGCPRIGDAADAGAGPSASTDRASPNG